MSRYTGPSWKVSRRLGISLSGTGKELARRPYAPGQHGQNNRRKLSEYGLQLREKQKLRMTYGLSERQFANLFLKAGKIREGKHAVSRKNGSHKDSQRNDYQGCGDDIRISHYNRRIQTNEEFPALKLLLGKLFGSL